MIWQYNVRVVVMLTNVVEGTDRFTLIKCNKYWPDNVGDSKKFGDIQVQLFDRAEVGPAFLPDEITDGSFSLQTSCLKRMFLKNLNLRLIFHMNSHYTLSN